MSHQSFACLGSRCGVWAGSADAVADARRRLERWHLRFSRFRADSELARLNADRRSELPVSATMARLLQTVADAAAATGGLVDGTLLREIETAGYRTDLAAPLPLELALRLAPPRRPAGPSETSRWREITVRPAPREDPRSDADGGARGFVVRRPPGVAIDSGGLAKGLFADLLAAQLSGQRSFAIDCGGDLRFRGPVRKLDVADPFGGPPLHTFELAESAVATSGIGRRSWLDGRGRPAHHLLDPATGTPAFTGVVQATALAPTAVEAEWRAKAAVLSGPDAGATWLEHGGVIVLDDGSHRVVPANSQPRPSRFSRFAPKLESHPELRRTR